MDNATALLTTEAAAMLLLRLDGLLLYRSVLDSPGLMAWLDLLRAGLSPGLVGLAVDRDGPGLDGRSKEDWELSEEDGPALETGKAYDNAVGALLRAYGHWFETMATVGLDWPSYVIEQVLLADNPWTRRLAAAEADELEDALKHYDLGGMAIAASEDVATLQQLLPWTGQGLSHWVAQRAGLQVAPAAWEPLLKESVAGLDPDKVSKLLASCDWRDELVLFFAHARSRGIGPWGRYRAFRWSGGQFQGIAHPDPVRLEQLVGYEWPTQQLLANTERLLQGQPALNVLLYGSRGAGKSSLVKALVNEYGDASQLGGAQRGLRLIEVAKAELQHLPSIVEQLRTVAQKFILFVDDLSFEADDEAFKSLKVVLEGSTTARPDNVVVYATSNRRHLVREFFGDRPRPSDADELHNWDTVQEKLSFSDRFGLTLTFEPADQDCYLAIVRHLVAQAGIEIEPADLDFRAKQWATRHNGRSGRTARQFVDWLQGESL